MTLRIHYEVKGIKDGLMYEDSIVLSGNTVEEIRADWKKEAEKRGLDNEKNNVWSEEL